MAAILEELNNEPRVSDHQKCYDLVIAYGRLLLTKVKPQRESSRNGPDISTKFYFYANIIFYNVWLLQQGRHENSLYNVRSNLLFQLFFISFSPSGLFMHAIFCNFSCVFFWCSILSVKLQFQIVCVN